MAYSSGLLLPVALLAEGVDRNTWLLLGFVALYVALLAEGVDRNCRSVSFAPTATTSPSSRRAWIEIPKQKQRFCK